MPAPQDSPQQAATASWAGANTRGWIGVILALLLVALIGIGWMAAKEGIDRAEIQLPLLAVAGVLTLLIALALTSVSFATFGIESKTEALALPSGSVRAVIALSLIVIFSILTVYLFSTLSSTGSTELVTDQTAAQRDAFMGKFSAEQLMHISSRATGNTPDTTPGAAKGAVVPTYTVYNTTAPNQAGQDFAKQLLVMLGVLLSSVTGFYFGAKTAQNASNGTTTTTQDTKRPPNSPLPPPPSGGDAGVQQAGDPKKLSAANLSPTPEAAALGQDPTLASEANADDLNKGAS